MHLLTSVGQALACAGLQPRMRRPEGRRRLKSALLLAIALAWTAHAATYSYHVIGDEPGPWPRILSSVSLTDKAAGPVGVFVLRGKSPLTAEQWLERVEKGAYLILEADTELSSALGFKPTGNRIAVRGIEDVHK